MTHKFLSIVLLASGTLLAQYGGYRSTDPYGRSNGRYDNRGGYNDRYGNDRYGNNGYGNNGYGNDRYGNNGYGNNGYGNNGYGNYQDGQRAIDSIQSDLSRIGQRAAWDRWAVKQFSEAVNNLERFQNESYRGKFDRGRLDKAIDNLNRLLTAPELHPRDKQRIASHRDQLRYIRSRNG